MRKTYSDFLLKLSIICLTVLSILTSAVIFFVFYNMAHLNYTFEQNSIPAVAKVINVETAGKFAKVILPDVPTETTLKLYPNSKLAEGDITGVFYSPDDPTVVYTTKRGDTETYMFYIISIFVVIYMLICTLNTTLNFFKINKEGRVNKNEQIL